MCQEPWGCHITFFLRQTKYLATDYPDTTALVDTCLGVTYKAFEVPSVIPCCA